MSVAGGVEGAIGRDHLRRTASRSTHANCTTTTARGVLRWFLQQRSELVVFTTTLYLSDLSSTLQQVTNQALLLTDLCAQLVYYRGVISGVLLLGAPGVLQYILDLHPRGEGIVV